MVAGMNKADESKKKMDHRDNEHEHEHEHGQRKGRPQPFLERAPSGARRTA
ncbi:unnamed protein product [Spirodela intermedia]|uniref:Uncharacterized protein n=1 Tax=Spirodela intermedia TaxID=51605 RepID=A0A7I8ICR6_SPIIN|nr:unnamed protein product [Spirodela intermedia]CAA6654641.1 unnamed protein product [Spirodela intermedia]